MQPPTFADIASAKYVSLTTFRRNGEPVSTPVWIAPGRGERSLYMFTGTRAGKVRRIRRDPRVELAPCSFRGRVLGPAVRGMASIIPCEELKLADRALSRKYPVAKRLLFAFNRVTSGRRAAEYGAYLRIELVPASVLREAAS